MEEFEYVDLFSTKGPEYLVVIVFLISFVVFLKFLNKPAVAVQIPVTEKIKLKLVDWFSIAEKYLYHKSHTWVRFENTKVVRIGIDDFAQRLIGYADEYKLPIPGERLKQGEKSFRILKDQKSVGIISPISGKVIEVNNEIIENPSLVNQSPYEEGWILKVEMEEPENTIPNLLSGKAILSWLEETTQKLNQRITGEPGMVLQDGGEPVIGFAAEIAGDDWEKLVSEFMHPEAIE